jgi:hypothetical protein
MTLLHIKKLSFVAAILLIVLTAQEALADKDQLFCTTKSATDWYWSGQRDAHKVIDTHLSSDLPLLAWKKSENNGIYIRGAINSYYQFIVAQPAGGAMDEARAKKFCEALMYFCVSSHTSGYRHIGIGKSWSQSAIYVNFKNDQGRDSLLMCPHYSKTNGEHNSNGLIISHPDKDKSAGITYPR